jgi:DNA replication and repair protein RecF
MLLDDVMSELDAARRERLIELVRSGGQAVVAATEPEHVPGARDGDVELLLVADGAVAVEAAL